MDSSPDFSLKLRRGSSDSRDNFYMDFAQGIDSDIEEVDAAAAAAAAANLAEIVPPPPLLTADELDYETVPPPPPPPPPSASESGDGSNSGNTHQESTVLRNLSDQDDLPSPPVSPTTSVVEMMPAPEVEYERDTTPVETEDEGEDEIDPEKDEGSVEQTVTEEEGQPDVDEEETFIPPPPVATPPDQGSESCSNDGDDQLPQPMQGSTPSISPSPPITPPPCPELTSLAKIVSPPPVHLSQIPPLTPPSDTDQSQPNSPTPPKRKQPQGLMPTTPPSPPLCDMVDRSLSTPPLNLVQEVLQGIQQGGDYEQSTSFNDDESTTITTPPTNGYSASSLAAPYTGSGEGIGDLDLCSIPPPMGMEDEIDDKETPTPPPPPPLEDEEDDDADGEGEMEIEVNEDMDDEEEEDEKSQSRTPVSETKPYELDETSSGPMAPSSIEGFGVEMSADGAMELDADERALDEGSKPPSVPGTPTSQISQLSQATHTPTISGSPKRRSSVVVSRSGSQKSSLGSRGEPVTNGDFVMSSSPLSTRRRSSSGSIRSTGQRKRSSTTSQQTIAQQQHQQQPSEEPQEQDEIEVGEEEEQDEEEVEEEEVLEAKDEAETVEMPSPQEGDRPPDMPSPPPIRSPPPEEVTSESAMHSPAKVTSPPLVYSPQLVKTPPKPPCTEAIPDEHTTVTYQDEQTAKESTEMAKAPILVRHQISSHHHYHLPHQFQHPHHQNHHTHSHGMVPVSTPVVPASYSSSASFLQDSRHKRAPSGSADELQTTKIAAGTTSATTTTTSASSSNVLSTKLLLASTERAVSPGRLSTGRIRDLSGSQHRVTIDESNLPVSSSSLSGVVGGSGAGDGDGSGPPSPGCSTQHLESSSGGPMTLLYQHHAPGSLPVVPALKRTHRPSFIYPPMPRVKSGDALATLFSALYGKLLVVMGIAFPMAEVISTYIPPSFYEVYYLYLYIGSMIFLLFMYATLLWGRPKLPPHMGASPIRHSKGRSTSASESIDDSDTDSNSMHKKRQLSSSIPSARRPSLLAPLGGRQHHYGSFYLRMGAVAFGIGSMIYSGLEFGQYFELNPDTKCHNVLLALTPATRMAFIFIQMYFIFLNNEQIKVYRHKIIARFGLMHMIGTNLAVWLNVLIQETKHEILTFYNPENRTLRISHRIPGHSRAHSILAPSDPTALVRLPRGLKGPYQIFECRRTNILGTLVQDASPFLFPCTIEYSLICAAILYVMWRGIVQPTQTPSPQRPEVITSPLKRSPHHYSVDCARAHKGLFVGILVLVLTIISLILFFVLISRPDFVALAVMEVTICELVIYATATIATLLGMIQIRHLQYDAFRSFSLDDILLVGAQTGSFLYNIFTVIAGHFSLRSDDWLVPLNALASIVQTACQTMFILDAGRRQAILPEHIRKKPGREIVTFMLVVNLAMWAISTLEKSRAESHPIQLNFYGLWAWTIITHVSMPLAIFYRFHSTVCLCEIWKRAYKSKPTYM